MSLKATDSFIGRLVDRIYLRSGIVFFHMPAAFAERLHVERKDVSSDLQITWQVGPAKLAAKLCG